MKKLVLTLIFLMTGVQATAEWKIDFSRRQQDLVEMEKQQEISKQEDRGFLDMVFERQAPTEEIVLMHTEQGFLPQTIKVKKNQRYKVHVVNVNKIAKNVSFMFDAFSEHHGTYFAEPVSFVIEPRQEGMFHFSCPETASKGQLVVTGLKNPIDDPLQSIELRQPASR